MIFRNGRLGKLATVSLTLPEAAYVAGMTVRGINHEIDEKIIEPRSGGGGRRVEGADLLYLGAVKNFRTAMGRPLRLRFRAAIVAAARADRSEAVIEHFTVSLDRVEAELMPALQRLRDVETNCIESLPTVLAGEPVIKGTRIAARHVADLIRHGASEAELAEEFDLAHEQIEAALIFDRVVPRLGRPATRRRRGANVSAP